MRTLRRRKQQPTDIVPTTTDGPPPSPYPPSWPGIYLGVAGDGAVTAGSQHSALVLGPPRSGKTSSVVVPTVLSAPGAVVSTSTKLDVLAVTAPARTRRGRTWIFDPTAAVTVPAGLTALAWSPVAGAGRWADAVAAAHALARAGRPGRGLVDADHWAERAEALLAPLLHAAALAHLDIGWVLRWVLRRELSEPAGLIARRGGDPLAGETLTGIARTEERERSGIFSTTASILSAYRSPDALTAAKTPNFDPDNFVCSSDTVYICAPGSDQEQVAPIIVALLDRIRRATYRRPPGWPPVLWALDEVANIAPLPSLPAVVAEGGSQGLVTLACLQDLSQARTRWGPAADGFLTLFTAKLVLGGIADMATLQLVSALAGQIDIPRTAVTKPQWRFAYPPQSPTVSTSWERHPALPPDHIANQPPGTALLIGPAMPPTPIGLTPCWADPWRTYLTNGPQPDGERTSPPAPNPA